MQYFKIRFKQTMNSVFQDVVARILVTSIAFAGVTRAATDSSDAFAALADGYERNRESFPSLDCTFRHIKSFSPTREDALKGRMTGKETVRSGKWLVSGTLVRYELLCDPELIHEAERRMTAALKSGGDSMVSVPCIDVFYLKNTDFTLRYGPLTLAANMFTNTDVDPTGIRVTPFNVDFMGADEYSNPARYLRDCISGRFEGTFLGRENILGVNALCVSLRYPNGRMKFAFDPERNYMLLFQSDEQNGEALYEVFALGAREFSGGRWFPTKVIKLINPSKHGEMEVEQVLVDSIHVDMPIAKERFELTLAKGTQVSVGGRAEWTNIMNAETINVDGLADLNQRCVAQGKAYQSRRTQAQQQLLSVSPDVLPVSGFRILLLGVNVLAVFTLAYFIFFRRSRSVRG